MYNDMRLLGDGSTGNGTSKMATSAPQQAWRTAKGIVPRPTDVFIAVMGVTGAGKSTFISTLTDEEVEIGHDMESCEFSVLRPSRALRLTSLKARKRCQSSLATTMNPLRYI